MSDLLETIGGLIFLAVITAGICFGIIIHSKHVHENDINTYNNGICECGGNYEFINYTQGYGNQAYVFQCDSCNKIVTFKTNPIE